MATGKGAGARSALGAEHPSRLTPQLHGWIILYANPDRAAGAYAHLQSWEFGETVRLPEPFGVVIATDDWEPWR